MEGAFSMQNHRKLRKQSDLAAIFQWHDERGRGRCCMLASAAIVRIIQDLTTGTLYTAFLTVNNFSIVDAGIISVLPLLASCFTIFSPYILERFPRRKGILAAGRLTYYLLNILGLTLLPFLIQNQTTKLWAFGILVFISGIFNHLFASGYTVWHLNFIEEPIRFRYFSIQQFSTSVLTSISILTLGVLADSLRGTAYEAQILIAIRMLGLVLAIGDVILLSLPKEYPYPKKEATIRVVNIFRLPIRNRKFMFTMALVAVWQFAMYLPQSSWHYYLLNTVEAGVAMTSLFMPFTTISYLLTASLWRRFQDRFSWWKTFLLAGALHAPAVFISAFVVRSNFMWLYPSVILFQTLEGVGLNLAWLNFPYINTPKHDQTYYISFYTLLINVMAFLGQLSATVFLGAWGSRTVMLLGTELSAVQLLLVVQAVLDLGCVIVILTCMKRLEPDRDDEKIPAAT